MGTERPAVGHAFLSYARADSHSVDRLQRILEAARIPVWRDTSQLWPGEDWRAHVRSAITDNAIAFIACFSQSSVSREKGFHNNELLLAAEQLRLRQPGASWLIPVRFDDCAIPELDIGGGRTLASIQALDLFGEKDGESAGRLVAAVLRILGRRTNSDARKSMGASSATADSVVLEASATTPTALPPRRYTRLIGREQEVSDIMARLSSQDRDSPAILAVTGLGGIGKTAVAREVAERCLIEGGFDDLIWESAKPGELEGGTLPESDRPELSYQGLLGAIARQLGLDALTQLPPREMEARLRVILRARSCLIVVDNLETVAVNRALAARIHDLISPGRLGQPTRALLTSRERLADLPYLLDYYLRGLSEPDSHAFLRQDAQDRNAFGLISADPGLLSDIFEITQGMPLAMKLVVSQYLLGVAVDAELERLKEAEEEELYRFLYLRLWFKLTVPAQKVLVAAAAFSASVARLMLQPVSETPDDDFAAALTELTRMSLLDPSDHPTQAQRRYSIHQMTRWFINSPLREIWEQQRTCSLPGISSDLGQRGLA